MRLALTLRLKEQVEAETRATWARAEQAEAQAQVAHHQAELLEMRQQAERELIRQMHERRLAEASDLLRQEAQAQLAPHLAALAHAREVIHHAVAGALADIRNGKSPSAQRIGSLRKSIDLYRLVSAGEVALDDKVMALEAIVQEPTARRNARSFEAVLAEVETLSAVEAARLELEGREDEWDAFFKVEG